MPEGAVCFHDASYRAAGGQQILRGISLSIAEGERVALLGRSGSGKTTLLRTINGMVRLTGGSVSVNGRDVGEWNPVELRRGIGYVIQEGGLFPNMTVGRNITLLMETAGAPAAERHARAQALLRNVGLPSAGMASRMPWQLSGGQRQRAGVARALANNAGLLLMDEPFGALDPLTRRDMQRMVHALLQKLHTTLVLVTHDLEEALRLATRLVLLEEGSVAADLSPGEFSTSDLPAVRGYREAFHGPLFSDGAGDA